MEPSDRITPVFWMETREARAVLGALTARGQKARFVGGCVRDTLAARPVKDIDIATADPPETVMALLQEKNIRVVPTGLAHGTLTAVVGAAHFEITTLRRDVETYGRHAKVAFTDDWLEDAKRRDFTFNALYLDADGTLYDPFGGREDLARGRVRFVGEPSERIREDVLRILRFFRFHAWYGSGAPDRAALAACRALSSLLPTLSAERVWSELRRTLMAESAEPLFRLMARAGVLKQVLPSGRRFGRLRALAALEKAHGLEADPIRRLAALLKGKGAQASTLAARLRLSNAERDRLITLVEPPIPVSPAWDETRRRRVCYRLGANLYRDLVLMAWASRRATLCPLTRTRQRLWGEKAFDMLYALPERWATPVFPVQGRDVLALGVAPGERVGALLSRLEGWWIGEDFAPTREACLARLREMVSPADAPAP